MRPALYVRTKSPNLCRAQLIDMIQQLFETSADLLAFRPQRVQFFGELRVFVARLFPGLVRLRQFPEGRFLLLRRVMTSATAR